MRQHFQYIISLILMVGCCSCVVNNRLPPGEKLYYGAEIKIQKAPEIKTPSGELRKKLADLTAPKRNKMILSQPYKVWWWYVIGQPKKEKGIRYWLRNRFGEAPITSQSLNLQIVAQNMEALLENEGYFNSKVIADTLVFKKKLKAI